MRAEKLKSKAPTSTDLALVRCQVWLQRAVIGLSLGARARAPLVAGRIRWVLCETTERDGLVEEGLRELDHVRQQVPDEVDTTLPAIPYLLADFKDCLDLLHGAEALIQALGFTGEFQLASFHADYRLEGAEADAIENCANRSPLPMLHLLREDSSSRVVDAGANVDLVPERNVQRLSEFGHAGRQRLFDAN